MRARRVAAAAAAVAVGLLALISACSADGDWHTCDPLVPEHCGLPFPNNFWYANGMLNLSSATFPKDRNGNGIAVENGGWNRLDGFSPGGPIQVFFQSLDLAQSGLPTWQNMDVSVTPQSPSLLVDATTGELIPHWVELDHASDNTHPNGYNRTLLMWPSKRLRDSSTYIVAFQMLKDSKGAVIKSSRAFSALRDEQATTDPAIETRRPIYNANIFPKLKAVGVPQSMLTLAWEFTVMSTRTLTNRLVTMRDDALKRVVTGVEYRNLKLTEKPNADMARKIQGEMKVPWYLNQVEPGVGVRVVTDPHDPNVALYNGDNWVQFTVLIPQSVVDSGTRAAVMQYGHGLFGDQGEVNTGYLNDEANKYGYVLGAVNWIGLSEYDEAFVVLMMTEDLSDFAMVPDRCHQGMLNALMLMRLMTSPKFVNDPATQPKSRPTIDPTIKYYFGNSQGGILGTVYMAVTTDVPRGVIGVGGGPYALLLPRSSDFTYLFDDLKIRYQDPQDRMLLFNLLQLLWNRLDPVGWVNHITGPEVLPGCPQHHVIFHYGLGDAQVSWLGTHFLARSAGALMYESNVREQGETLFGFPKISDDTVLTNSNLVQGWDFGALPVPIFNIPPSEKTDAHEKPRRSPAAQAQMHQFLLNGTIYNACGGKCTV